MGQPALAPRQVRAPPKPFCPCRPLVRPVEPVARRTVPALALALLAVAWPAAAEPEPLPDPCGLRTCTVLGAPAGQSAEDVLQHGCAVWDISMPDSSQPVWESVVLDPDGCIREFLRRTLGWPPLAGTDGAVLMSL